MRRDFKLLNRKQKNALSLLIGKGTDMSLACLSSEYSEGDEKEFKTNYGVTFAEAHILWEMIVDKINKELK